MARHGTAQLAMLARNEVKGNTTAKMGEEGEDKKSREKCTDEHQVSGRKCQQVTSQAASGQPAKTCHMSPCDLCAAAEESEQTPRLTGLAGTNRNQQESKGTGTGATAAAIW